MHYGAHIFVWLSHFGDGELAELLVRARDLGLSFLEIPIGDDIEFDASALAHRAEDAGLQLVLSPGGLWPMHCDISLNDSEARGAGLDWHRRALDLCAACGAAAYTGALYGHPGRITGGPPSDSDKDRIAEGLHTLAVEAAARGVTLALEPMSHFRTSVANTPEQIVELTVRAGHPNLRCLMDTYHLGTEITDFGLGVRTLLPYLWGIHACANNRGVPGTGIIPWNAIAAELRAADWQGYVGFESYNSSCDGGKFALSRGMFHNVCPDGDAFVRQALDFMENLLPR